MALPLLAIGLAHVARYLGTRALAGALARRVATRALLAARASRSAAVVRRIAKEVWRKAWSHPEPEEEAEPYFASDPIEILPSPAFTSPGVEAGYDLDGWTVTTDCGPAVYATKNATQTACATSQTITKANWDAYLGVLPTRLTISGGYRYRFNSARSMEYPHPAFGAGYVRTYTGIIAYRDYITKAPTWTPPDPDTDASDLWVPAVSPVSVPLHYAGAVAPLHPPKKWPYFLPNYMPQMLPIQNYIRVADTPFAAIPALRQLSREWPEAPVFAQPAAPSPPVTMGPAARPVSHRLAWPGLSRRQKEAPHFQRKPTRHEKEKKLTMSKTASRVWNSIAPVTEGLDFLYCLYRAIPNDLKPRYQGLKGPGLYGKKSPWFQPPPDVAAKAVWDHWRRIDGAQAAKNVLNNEIGDLLVGAQAQALRNTLRGQIGNASPTFAAFSRAFSQTQKDVQSVVSTRKKWEKRLDRREERRQEKLLRKIEKKANLAASKKRNRELEREVASLLGVSEELTSYERKGK